MECPYHHRRWRGQMQCLLNALRGRLLKGKHIRRFAAVVCACEEKARGSPTGQLEALQGLLQWLEEEATPTSLLGPAAPSLKSFLAGGSDPARSEETREALVGVVSLVRELNAGDYHRLEPNRGASEAAKGMEEELELPLDSAHLGVFMGRGGKHIKPLCREHGVQVHFKAAAESGSGSRRQSHTVISGSSVKVVLRCKEGGWERLQHMGTELKKRAERVTHRRKEHEKDVSMYYKIRTERFRVLIQRARQRRGRQRVGVGIYQNSKEAAKRQFEKKQKAKAKNPTAKPSSVVLSSGHCLHCMSPYATEQMEEGACKYQVSMYYKIRTERSRVLIQRARQRGGRQRVGVGIYQNSKEAAKGQFEKKRKAKAKNPTAKPSSVVLSSGHCLHCMSPYATEQMEEGACKYHSGFLAPVKPGKDKGYYWSCCQKRTAAQHPTHELHTRTGCSSGRHVWRAGKGGRGKTTAEKENITEEIFVN